MQHCLQIRQNEAASGSSTMGHSLWVTDGGGICQVGASLLRHTLKPTAVDYSALTVPTPSLCC